MAHESTRTLAELWAEHAATAALPPDVLEIATLQAQEAGITVADRAREAVLAHAAGSVGGAQSAQAQRRAAELERRATPNAAP